MKSRTRAALILSAATMATGLTALPAHAATTYYVDITNTACSDSGSGTAAVPFCNIQAGVNAAAAGDTVEVMKPSVYGSQGYKQPVTISSSGTAQAPINIVASQPTQQVDTGAPFIFQLATGGPFFTFNGASNVRLYGFPILNYTATPVIGIQNSSNIDIDTIGYKEGSGDVTIDGASSGITISRSVLGGVSIGSGASNIALVENYLDATAPIAATSVNGLTITGNTVRRGCPSGIDVEGTSQNVSIENNIVTDDWGWDPSRASSAGNCMVNSIAPPNTNDSPEITVSQGSAAHTVSDYNDIFTWQSNQAPAYSWNGAVYQTVAQFNAATKQGAHDIDVSPWPIDASFADPHSALLEGSPAIDSGDANAPGLLATDIIGNARADDPYIANTGTGSGYVDRGAYEFVPPASNPATVTVTPTTGTYPLTVTATAAPPSGWGGASSYSFNFNDGTGWTTPSWQNKVQHTYALFGTSTAGIDVRETLYDAVTSAHDSDSVTVTPGSAALIASLGLNYPSVASAPVPVTASGAASIPGAAPIASYTFDFGDGSGPFTVQAAAGNSFTHPMAIGIYTAKLTVTDVLGNTAATSQRLIVGTNAALAPKLTVTEQAPVNGLVPVTLDPTGTTDGLPISSYTFNFGDNSAPIVVNAATAAPQTRMLPLGLYTTTLTVTDAYNRSQAVSQNIAIGAGFNPYGPTRVMDTRKGIGVSAGAVPAYGTVKLTLPQALRGTANSPAIAVVLNVTVTAPGAGGYVTVYPDEPNRPNSSNLNFSPGETVPNQVTVPVGPDGTVDFYLGSGASAQLVADVEGFYTLGSGAGYAGAGPKRVLDTRSGLGGAGGRLAGGGTLTLSLPTGIVPASATAVVLNVTVVNPSSGGYLTVYPDGTGLPTASNLNFWPHDTVPNLVVVRVTDGKVDFHLGSSGSADLVADVSGYYSASANGMLLPFAPTRLVDTRQTAPLPGGGLGRLNLANGLGLPPTRLSAALYNVTVTRPQSSGYLTVFPDGLPTMPTVSNLNFVAGQTVPNAVQSPLIDGMSDFYNGAVGQTDVVIDLFGLFAPAISPGGATPATAHVGSAAPWRTNGYVMARPSWSLLPQRF